MPSLNSGATYEKGIAIRRSEKRYRRVRRVRRKTQGSPGTPPFRPLAQPLAGLHCRVPGVVTCPSGAAFLRGKGVLHNGAPQFYRVTVQPHLVNVGAIQRQAGLEQMVGNPTVAFHMGPQEELAVPVGAPTEFLLCQDCGIAEQSLAVLMEMAEDQKEKTDGTD